MKTISKYFRNALKNSANRQIFRPPEKLSECSFCCLSMKLLNTEQ